MKTKRICSNVIGCPIASVKIGMDVEVVFDDMGEVFSLPNLGLQ